MRGNLAPDCGVVKKSAVAPEMWTHSGPARVFNSEEEACKAIFGGAINPGDVVVIRYEGPAGGPGMREMLTPPPPPSAAWASRARWPSSPDGRFSGASKGPCIGHVSPEAAAGGPIALVQEGDVIDIDIQAGTLELRVADDVLAERRAAWEPPAPKYTTGVLSRYARLVTSADKGGIPLMITTEEKIARRQRAIEGRPFGPGSHTEHEGKTMTGAQAHHRQPRGRGRRHHLRLPRRPGHQDLRRPLRLQEDPPRARPPRAGRHAHGRTATRAPRARWAWCWSRPARAPPTP